MKPLAAPLVIDSVTQNQVNRRQASINIAYVLTETVGPAEGLRLLQDRINSRRDLQADLLDVLDQAGAVLTSKVDLQKRQTQADK